MLINPYLHFNGECEAAFRFYAEVLGGTIEAMITHEGTPAESQVAPEWKKKIIHARLSVGGMVIMGSDAPAPHFHQPQGFAVSVSIDDPEEAARIFNALAGRGTIRMPLQQTFWAARFGMLVDRFGTPWMINCEGAR